MLNGSDVEQDARQQMVIMFMIAASNALSCIVATYLVLKACIDSEYRIRAESIDTDPHALFHRAGSVAILAAASNAGRAWILATSNIRHLLQELRGLASAAMSTSG
jgi:hypothetical protein